MQFIIRLFHRATTLGVATTLLIAATAPAISISRTASAASLTDRNLMVTSTVASDDTLGPNGSTYTGLAAGDPRNGAQVGHEYTFKVGTAGVVRGFTIEYCTTAFGFVGDGACTGPTGLSGSDWNGKTVVIDGGTFTVNANAANYLTLTSTGGTTNLASGTTISIDFNVATGFFVNPNTNYRESIANGTYFAHISTFGSNTDAAAAYTHTSANPLNPTDPVGIRDDGTVANNVTTAIGIYTRIQETLNFSVEGDQDGVGGTSDGPSSIYTGSGPCTALTAPGQLKMGDMNHALSTQSTSKAKSYFRLSTNSTFGTTVFYTGATLQSPNHNINAPSTQTPSQTSTEQFGIAFDLTDGTNNVGNGSQLTPETPYENNANGYAFNGTSPSTPKPIARTLSGGVVCDTGAVEYIANISPDTPAGIYQTKISYIASPAY